MGVDGAEGGVALLGRVAREGLTEMVTLIKHLKEVSKCLTWPFEEQSRQRE